MNRLIELALRQRMLVLMLLIVTILAGVVGYANLNIEAYPDPVPPLVEVITQSNGISSEEMERNISALHERYLTAKAGPAPKPRTAKGKGGVAVGEKVGTAAGAPGAARPAPHKTPAKRRSPA